MKNFKKRLSLILAALTLLSATAVFAGCATSNEDDDEDKKNPQQTTPGTEVESVEVDHRFDGVDYKDRSFRIYTNAADTSDGISNSNFLIEGNQKTEGNMVNDAVLERNITVEELLGVKLEFTQSDIAFDAVASDIRTLTQAGTDEFDLVVNSIFAFSELLIEGNFRNTLEPDCVFDFDRDYWYRDYMEDLRLLNGHQYVLAGDYFIDVLRSAHLLLVNKSLYKDYNKTSADELYDVVSNYEWTFDKMNTVCSDMYVDLNHTGAVDDGDQFGFMTASYWGGAIPFMISGNPTYITRDDDGVPAIAIQEGERANLMAVEMSKVFNNESAGVAIGEVPKLLNAFTQNQCLMLGYQRLGSLEDPILRSMEGDAAVLPYPMLFASDHKYTTSTHDTTSMGAILTTSTDLEFISTVVEVLNRETANILMPKYYKESLQVQCVDDEKAAAMIDIIHDNFGQSFILAYNSALGGQILQSFTTCIQDKREYSAVFTPQANRINKNLSNKIRTYLRKNNIDY